MFASAETNVTHSYAWSRMTSLSIPPLPSSSPFATCPENRDTHRYMYCRSGGGKVCNWGVREWCQYVLIASKHKPSNLTITNAMCNPESDTKMEMESDTQRITMKTSTSKPKTASHNLYKQHIPHPKSYLHNYNPLSVQREKRAWVSASTDQNKGKRRKARAPDTLTIPLRPPS